MKKIMTSAALLFAAALAFISCGDKDPITPGYGINIPDLVLDFDKSVIQASGNDVVTFRAFKKGQDVSASSTLFLVEGETYTPMTSMTFSVSKEGSYTFQVAHGPSKSDVVKISAISKAFPQAPTDGEPQSTDFVHRTFFNQHTGAGCPNCPFMTYLLKKTLTGEVKDKVVLASLRNYSGEAGLKALIERRTSSPAKVGISATPVYYEDGQIVLTVAVKAAVTDEYNVGVWLMQDGYKKTQTVDNGRLSLLGPEGFTDDYHYHNNCVRVAESKYLGSHVGYPLGRIEAGKTKEWRFVFNVGLGTEEYSYLDHWWEGQNDGINLDDLHFAAFVTTHEGTVYTVVNAIDFPYDEAKPFEYND